MKKNCSLKSLQLEHIKIYSESEQGRWQYFDLIAIAIIFTKMTGETLCLYEENIFFRMKTLFSQVS